ncbi:hypothetical protein BGZ73_004515 [Actinomortierella ambigua]|nr:hypothetical protein BGZ73_004515 [Actinomortierella ambigua]
MPCAAKILLASYADLSSAAVQKEVNDLLRLRHRHIIQYYEIVQHDRHMCILMDLAEKESLASAIVRGEVSDWQTKTRIAHEITRGLEYLHRCEVLHRDLNTTNVLLTQFMEVKLCDFGLAQVKTLCASATRARSKGSLGWAAPETVTVRPKYSTKSDVYMLGMVMWAMAANLPQPFGDQQDNLAIVALVRSGKREEIPEDTPAAFRSWIERCWHQDPLMRPEAKEVVLVENGVSATPMGDVGGFPSLGSNVHSSSRGQVTASEVCDARGMLKIVDQGSDKLSQSQIESVQKLRMAADQGIAEAQVGLGSMYKDGRGVKQSDADAMMWYRRAAEQGHKAGQFHLGMMYYRGEGVDEDNYEALMWFRRSADQGYSAAQVQIGVMYECGYGVEQSDEKAVYWYHKAATLEDATAELYLGLAYEHGQSVQQDYAQAVTWYRKAAVHDNAQAQLCLGNLFLNGYGVEQNDTEAVSWYTKAAHQQYAEAQASLGLMYELGRGVDKNATHAMSWYRKAAEHGDTNAKHRLGEMYEHGIGVEKGNTVAAPWYRKAAERGHAKAKRSLGMMYGLAQRIEKDDVKAVNSYRKPVNKRVQQCSSRSN